jgi:predicted MPP superfamily phosphohydrolase
MKLVHLSDLHTNSLPYSTIRSIQKIEPDVIVLGGDIATGEGGECSLESIFVEFRKLTSIPILFIPGNHDLWSIFWPPQINSSDIAFYTDIPKLCKENNILYLETDSLIKDDWLLSGTIGWYDYSFKYHQYATMPDEYFYRSKRNYNNDGTYIKSAYNDVTFANKLKLDLMDRIKKQQRKVQHVAVFTHVPVFEECVTIQDASNHNWNFGSSYFYNLSLGKELKKVKKLKLVVSGHTHKGFEAKIDNRIEFYVNPSDYGMPKILAFDLLPTGDIIEIRTR